MLDPESSRTDHPLEDKSSLEPDSRESVPQSSALAKPHLVQFISKAEEARRPRSIDLTGCVHGVDYIIDYYAMLGVPRDADKESIKSAYREASRGCHPDVLARANDSLRAAGERQFTLLSAAYEVLSNDARRGPYDRLLASFPPELVSATGSAIINLNSRRIVADILASGSELHEPEREAFIAGNCGFSPEIFALVESQLKAAGDSAPDALKQLFRDQLIDRLAAATMREDTEWRAAGVLNQTDPRSMSCGADLIALRAEQIAEVPSELARVTEQRLLASGSGAAPLLLAADSHPEIDTTELGPLVAHVITELGQRFAAHKRDLMAAAKERAAAFDQLLELTEWRYVPSSPPGFVSREFVLYLASGDQVAGGFRFRVEGSDPASVKSLNFETANASLPLDHLHSENRELAALTADRVNALLLVIEKNLPLEAQIGFVVGKHVERVTGESSVVSIRPSQPS